MACGQTFQNKENKTDLLEGSASEEIKVNPSVAWEVVCSQSAVKEMLLFGPHSRGLAPGFGHDINQYSHDKAVGS